jgi:phosphate transport system substrate-binding protein
MKKIIFSLALVLAASNAHARDTIVSVGSSTVYPFTTIAAERFAQDTGSRVIVESTGTGGGMKLFCNGIGVEHPDMTGASRAMKKKEAEKCAANNVTFEEVQIGFDGITISNSINGPKVSFTKEQIFKAVSDTKFKLWNEIDPQLPATPVSIMVPPPTSGTRDAFIELVMHDACKEMGVPKKEIKAKCSTMREDGAVIIMGENDNLIVEKLVADPNMFGVFGFSFLDSNLDKVQGSKVNDVAPTFATIADGSYKVSRPLFVYFKNDHMGVIPGLAEFKEYYTKMSRDADSPLAAVGLIPLK